MRSRALVLALVLLAGVACSHDEAPPPAAAASPSPSPEPEPVCPLTGEDPGGVVLSRPAVAVKIENSPEARPQAGLEDADIVYEEVVEGGITRFMAIFHCGSSSQAGPVRSARFDDPKLAKPFTSLLAFSGANGIVENELRAQGIIIADEDTAGGALFRVPAGVLQLHNLFADTEALRKLARKQKVKPPKEAGFDFGDITGKPDKARKVTVHFTSSNEITWTYRGGKWKRTEAGVPFMTRAGDQLAVENLLIQQVDVNNSRSIVDVAGNPSPDIDLEGSGKALLFRDGKVIKGTWTIRGAGMPTVFERKSGDRFTFKPGETFIELVPSAKGSVRGSFSFK